MDITPIVRTSRIYNERRLERTLEVWSLNMCRTCFSNDNNPLTSLIIDDITTAHNASLVIDDIQDDSVKRRGQPCAHLVYGMPLALE